MTIRPHKATGSVSVRLPVELLAKLDALCQATERTRSYWLAEAAASSLAPASRRILPPFWISPATPAAATASAELEKKPALRS